MRLQIITCTTCLIAGQGRRDRVARLLRREMQDNPADVAKGREVGRGGGEALREQDGDDGQVRAHQLPLRRRRRRQGVHEHQQARQRKRANESIFEILTLHLMFKSSWTTLS